MIHYWVKVRPGETDILGFRMKHIYLDKLNELEDTRLTPQ